MQATLTIDEALSKIRIGKFHYLLLLILGIVQSCDVMEYMILVFLGPILTCSWRISFFESSLLIGVVLIGSMVGASCLGKFSDKYGRKKTLLLSNAGLIYFGLICVGSPTIYWVIITRFFVGVFIGGNSSCQHALMSEFTPPKYRGIFMLSFQFFSTVASCLITVLSYLIIPVFGWRLLIAVATIPIFSTLFALLWVPESPRYLLLKNRKEECIDIINRVARMNNSLPIDDIQESPVSVAGSWLDLLHPKLRLSTIILNVTLFILGLTYFTVVLILTVIDGIPHKCFQIMFSISFSNMNTSEIAIDNSCCVELTWKVYMSVLISTAGELILLPISVFLINWAGRKKTMIIYLVSISIGIFLINLCLSTVQLSVLVLFLRGTILSFYSVVLIYASELFPTTVRSLGLGTCVCSSRIGAILAPPYLHFMITRISFIGGILLLFLMDAIVLIAVCFLPYETKNRKLYQTADDKETESETTPLKHSNPDKNK